MKWCTRLHMTELASTISDGVSGLSKTWYCVNASHPTENTLAIIISDNPAANSDRAFSASMPTANPTAIISKISAVVAQIGRVSGLLDSICSSACAWTSTPGMICPSGLTRKSISPWAVLPTSNSLPFSNSGGTRWFSTFQAGM